MSLYAKVNGSGTGTGGGGGGSTAPGGTTGEIQYNNAGAFGGDTSTTDGAGNLSITSAQASTSLLAPDVYVARLQVEGAGIVTLQAESGGVTSYNFNLPETAGTTGQYLTSGGGIGGQPMTWTTAPTPLTLGNLTSTPTTNLVVTGGTGAVIGSGALLTLTGASIVEATSSVLTLTGATNAVLGTGVTIQVKQATTSQSGYLSSTDWNTFNGKTSGGITSLTGGVTASGPGAAAATVITNANLTGVITSVGNATSIASQTGTGTKFVVDTSPTLVTPVIGAATGTSLSVSGQLTSTVATGTAPLVVSSTTQVANLNAATAGSSTTSTTATNLAGGLGGSVPYQSAAGTTAMLANGSAGQLLQSNGTTLAPTWVPAPSTSPLTTKGDVYTYTSTNARLPVGTNGQVLTAQSGQTTGLQWANATAIPAASTISEWDANVNFSANNHIEGYTTTATAASTTTLVVGSTYQQFFTGTTTQTVLLPVTSTLVLGQQYVITNNSTGIVTVQSSGANTIQAMAAGTQLVATVILTSGTGIASWSAAYTVLAVTAAVQPTIQKFTSSTGTYTTPTGVQYIRVKMVGGGGGGGGSGTSPTTATNGNNTTFGTTLLSAGFGIAGNSSGTAGGGGTFSLGSGPIGTGLPGFAGSGSALVASGSEGGGFGGGTSAVAGAGSAAVANSGGGGGGAGGNTGVYSGAGGGSGGFVDALITSPSATYSYAVGAGGAGGSAGTSGSVGGAGGSGYIEVTEYYINLSVGTTTSVAAGTFFAGPVSGSNANPTFRALQAPTVQSFTSSTGTYTTPAGVLYIKVNITGGGGAGGGSGASGNGNNGNNSTFGTSLLTAGGGAGGLQNSGNAGSGGSNTINSPAIATINRTGATGVGGSVSGASTTLYGGAGGGGGTGAGAANSGQGGSGGIASGAVNAGSGGGQGGILTAIIAAPSATYSYTVGAASTTSGTGAFGGGSGVITVEEYYQ